MEPQFVPVGLNAPTAIVHFAALKNLTNDARMDVAAICAASRYWFVPATYRQDTIRHHRDRVRSALRLYRKSGQLPDWMMDALKFLIEDLVRQAER